MRGNLQGELRQGLLVVKLPAAFWESNSRCHNFCSTAFTFLACLESSTLAKSVPQPLGWSRCRGLSPKTLHPHLALSLLPLLGSGRWLSFVAWEGAKRPSCRAMIMIADSPLTGLCPFSHPHLPSCLDHSNPRNFARSYSDAHAH